MNYLFDPRVQLAILVVLLVAVVLSFLCGPTNMVQNLIAEAVGIAVGVLLTVTLVERVLERRRREEWKEVRSQVFRAISTHISDIMMNYMVYVGNGSTYLDKVIEGRAKPTVEAADAMVATLEEMRKERDIAGVLRLFKETEWDFGRLRDVLTFGLIEFGEEPKLVELLIDMDNRHAAWKSYLIIDEEEGVIWGELEGTFDRAMDTLEALINLYGYLATS